MKIEMGESLFYSWLRHVKECQVVQTNWKVSPSWQIRNEEALQRFMKITADHERNGKLCANLKCEPLEADFLRQAFKAVIPGWHMNKVHWNTVICDDDCDVPDEEIKRMVVGSYDLTKPKMRRKN